MKKFFIIFILLLFCGCGKKTYYPNSTLMQKKLEEKGYTVISGTNFGEEYGGAHLYGYKDNDFIDIYWLNSDEFFDRISSSFDQSKCEKFISMENNSRFGSIISCSTNKALVDSGITIVE